MVERRLQPDHATQQHAVAKDVTAHVTNAHHRERLRLNVAAQLPEVELDALPCSPCRDTYDLVVVAVGTSGRERITQPITPLF